MKQRKFFMKYSKITHDSYIKRLAKLASEGWFPIKVGKYSVVCEQRDYQEVIFDYYETSDSLNAEFDEFKEMAVDCGWQHISNGLFYHDASKEIAPFFGNQEEYYEMIREGYKRELVTSLFPLALLIFFFSLHGRLHNFKVSDFLNVTPILNSILIAVMIGFGVFNLLCLGYWIHKSGKLLREKGAFHQPFTFILRMNQWMSMIFVVSQWFIILVLPLIFYMLESDSWALRIGVIVPAIIIAGFVAVIKRGIKVNFENSSLPKQFMGLLMVCLVVLVLFIVPIIGIQIGSAESKLKTEHNDMMPEVTLEELGFEKPTYVYYSTYGSILVTDYYNLKETNGKQILRTNYYHALHPEVAKLLFEVAYQELVSDGLEEELIKLSVQTDVKIWNADDVRVLNEDYTAFLLRKNDVVVSIRGKEIVFSDEVITKMANEIWKK